jgi:hypothetical protein
MEQYVNDNTLEPLQRHYSRLAITSVVCGVCYLAGWVWNPIFLLFTIPAIVCGHLALIRIKRQPQRLKGRIFALLGVLMGYLPILATLLFLLNVLFWGGRM